MRFSLKDLFAPSRGEQYLEQYVLREFGRGRGLDEILEDAYVRNRSTPEERRRLLDRPEIVAALGDHALAEMRHSLSETA